MMQQLEKPRKTHPWEGCLRKIYGLPASVTVIEGEWKTGKTDLALHIVEESKRLGLITKSASNIRCFKDKKRTIPDDSEVLFIDNFLELDAWMFSGYRKAFLYDEAIKSTPSRRAMSQSNTKWLEVIPELSKGRMHLIVITQELKYTESSFLHPRFVRGIWHKIAFPRYHPQFRKMVKLYSDLLSHVYVFRNMPPTKIVFDPYRSATFKLTPDSTQFENLPLEMKVAFDYAQGLSTDKIVDKYSELQRRYEAIRLIRRALKLLVEKYQVSSIKRRILDA